jgi:hypothetical protein
LSLLGDEGQTSVHKFAPKGWITGDLFREHILLFIDTVRKSVKGRLTLLSDGATSRANSEWLTKLQKKETGLVILLAHCSHILQPLDQAPFRAMKASVRRSTGAMVVDVTPAEMWNQIGAGLADALDDGLKSAKIRSGFARCGITLDPSLNIVLNPDKVLGRAPFVRDETEEERQSRLAQKKVTKATVLAGCIATSPEKIKDVQRLESKAQARGVTKTVAKRVNTPPSSPVAPPRRRRRV